MTMGLGTQAIYHQSEERKLKDQYWKLKRIIQWLLPLIFVISWLFGRSFLFSWKRLWVIVSCSIGQNTIVLGPVDPILTRKWDEICVRYDPFVPIALCSLVGSVAKTRVYKGGQFQAVLSMYTVEPFSNVLTRVSFVEWINFLGLKYEE